ncbi:hypothetical protein KW798_01360, partial [Candidatus Parcubacteria bacterium]|nr:hypothetical protein [Candidatus Parcubacteria bacterium]
MKKSIGIGAASFIGIFLFSQIAFAASTSSLLPNSDGNYLQWTPSTGVTHFTLVDESSCNGTTDYNFTTTVGNRDSYGVSLGSVPNNATITSIDIAPCASRNTAGGVNPTMDVFYRYNGGDSSDSGAYSLTGTTPTNLATTTFGSLALTKSSTSTLEIGAVLSSGVRGARLSRIATIITYTPAAPTVTTSTSTATTSTSFVLPGSANPNGGATTGWFRYATTTDPGTCDDSFGTRTPTSGGTSLGSGTTTVNFTRGIKGLTAN